MHQFMLFNHKLRTVYSQAWHSSPTVVISAAQGGRRPRKPPHGRTNIRPDAKGNRMNTYVTGTPISRRGIVKAAGATALGLAAAGAITSQATAAEAAEGTPIASMPEFDAVLGAQAR